MAPCKEILNYFNKEFSAEDLKDYYAVFDSLEKAKTKNDLHEETIKSLKSNRELKEKYAQNSFSFMKAFVWKISILIVLMPIFLSVISFFSEKEDYLDFVKLVPFESLAYTTIAAMALFTWFLRGLFSSSK